jgi:hypothetical protein
MNRRYILQLIPGRGGWERWDATELSGWLTEVSEWHFVTTGLIPPAVSDVEPRFVYCQDSILITVTGANFQPVPSLTLSGPYPSPIPLRFPLYLSSTQVGGYFQGKSDFCSAPGFYDLWVTNPDGGSTVFRSALYVTDTPVPRISAISPEAVTENTAFQLTLYGENFPPPFTVAVVTRDLATGTLNYTLPSTYHFSSSSQVEVTFSSGLPANSYLIRLYANTTSQVTIFTDYFALQVYGPSGNIIAIQPLPVSLAEPRMLSGTALGEDPLGNRFIYLAGGVSRPSSSPTASVEVLTLGRFGEILTRTTLPSRQGWLNAGRHSFSLGVSSSSFVYAFGGVTDSTGWPDLATGATFTVERAVILDPRRVPEIQDLTADTSTGILPAGFYSYRVAGVEPPTDPTNPGGETLPSPIVGVYLVGRGKITLRFKALPGAERYRIYRVPDAGGSPGSERFLSEVSASDVCSGGDCRYTDDGSVPVDPQGDTPLPPGALGRWQTLPVTIGVERAGYTLLSYSTGGPPYFLLVGGENKTGVLGSFTLISVGSGGDLNTLPPGDWLKDSSSSVTQPVAFAGGVTVTSRETTVVPEGEIWIVVTNGRETPSGGPVKKLTRAQVQNDGTLAQFCTSYQGLSSSPNCQRLNTPSVYGHSNLFVGGILHFVGGWDGIASTNSILDCKVTGSTPLDFINCNDNGTSLSTPRAFFGYVRFRGMNYVIGGYSGGTATATMEVFIR